MEGIADNSLRDQLSERRQKLEAVIAGSHEHAQLTQLLGEVDSALSRIDSGKFGICELCHEPIEKEGLASNPLLRFCLDHLSTDEQRALEADLDLAAQMQRGFLPEQNFKSDGWEVCYHYEPKGPVSGDYCDLVSPPPGSPGFYFAIGDVSGKGVAASLLMAQLRAIFRMLIPTGLPISEQIGRANRVFCESIMSTSFATLVWGRAGAAGEIELCNAGHCAPLLIRSSGVVSIEPTGLPLGMFCSTGYSMEKFQLTRGESLVLFTDGLSEAAGLADNEYGAERLSRVAAESNGLPPQVVMRTCLEDLAAFQSGEPKRDDLSLMVIRRTN
ncbi:MAG TPA: SpoIIE family protein phosphatase [Terriglobia bacterium]|nr:SpoIIE family protein phosphatase [Terriglobia bacterium]